MSHDILEAGTTKTTGAAAGITAVILPAAIGSGVRVPQIREIGIWNQSGVFATVGIGFPAALGTGTLTSVTVQDISAMGVTGNTKLGTSYGTLQPTAPTTFTRRFDLPAVAGAGVVFTWGDGEWPVWAGAAVNTPIIWQISAVAVTYDIYIKVAE